MSIFLRVLLLVSAISMLIFILKRIRNSKLKIEYTIFWIVFASILVIMGVAPEIVYFISNSIGFQSPISMVFLVIIFVLIIKSFYLTLQISQLENKLDNLVQQTAIDRKIDKDIKIEN